MSALLSEKTHPLTVTAFTSAAMHNALLSESVLPANMESITDRLMSSLKTTLLTALSVNTHPEITFLLLLNPPIIAFIALPINMEFSTSKVDFHA